MKRLLVRVKAAITVATVVVASMVSAYGTLTLTLEDERGNSKIITDGGADDLYPIPGVILWMGALPNGSVWTGKFGFGLIDVGLSKPVIGGPFHPQMDLSIQRAHSTDAGTLTITFADDGFDLLGNKGIATLAMGGANNQGTIKAYGLVNGLTVVSLDLLGKPWSGTAQGNVSGLGPADILAEKVVIFHSGAGYTMGNISLEVQVVPEPTTMIAGALLLLPFGFTCYRYLRNRKRA